MRLESAFQCNMRCLPPHESDEIIILQVDGEIEKNKGPESL